MAAVKDAISAAQAAVERGEWIDLTGLDRIVARLCADIRAMPSAQGRELTPLVTGLIDELTRLTETMMARRHHIVDAPNAELNKSAAGAAAAYRKHRR